MLTIGMTIQLIVSFFFIFLVEYFTYLFFIDKGVMEPIELSSARIILYFSAMFGAIGVIICTTLAENLNPTSLLESAEKEGVLEEEVEEEVREDTASNPQKESE